MNRAMFLAAGLTLALTTACDQAADAQTVASAATPQAQSGQGEAYPLARTQVWNVPDPVSGRAYQVFVQLPASYDQDPNRTYPTLYVTDAAYAFPLIGQIARRLNSDGARVEEFILVGLSYAEGDDPSASRRRDYTLSARPGAGSHEGGGPAYQNYLKTQALPFIEDRFRADPQRRTLLGHSLGGLLGAQIMFSEPELFSAYVLGSPSLWFNGHQIFDAETRYAANHNDLKAQAFLYIGDGETPGPGKPNRYDMVGDNKRFEARLRARNYPNLKIQAVEMKGEDHLTVAPIGFMRALEAVLPAK